MSNHQVHLPSDRSDAPDAPSLPADVHAVPLGVQELLDAQLTPQVVFALDLTLLAANPAYYKMTRSSPQAILGKYVLDAFPANPDHDENTESVLRDSFARVVATGEVDEIPSQAHDLVGEDGGFEAHHWRITHAPIRRGGEIVAILQNARDVTAEVLQGRLMAAKQRAATSGADLNFFEYDPSSNHFVRSSDVDALFGFTPGEVAEEVAPFFDRIHPEDRQGVQRDLDAVFADPTQDVLRLRYRVIPKPGEVRWVLAQAERITDPVSLSPRFVGVILDVTSIHETEAELRRAVDARDALLAEVNHRVKNSLQLVTSVLRLEASGARGTGAEVRLEAAAARIQAIAAVHARLYHTDDVRTVELKDFLLDFCRQLAFSAGGDERGVEVVVEAAPVRVATDKAIVLALIVNELVTNAFKHAFGTAGGTVRVTLDRSDGTGILTVEDDGDGTGISPEGNPVPSSGLGRGLVTTLSRQVAATMEGDDDRAGNGHRTRFVFPL
ncbi:sensor histidine kinase [Acuticoccus sp.]|uniref:sensor histidine kinase n=1 Tax=Acuticoccus sp. TaxID=1904378 RepID=UPI003B51F1C8